MPTLAPHIHITATISPNGTVSIEIPGLTPDFSQLELANARTFVAELDLSDPVHLQQFGEAGTEQTFRLLCNLDQATNGKVREVLSRIFAAGFRAGHAKE